MLKIFGLTVIFPLTFNMLNLDLLWICCRSMAGGSTRCFIGSRFEPNVCRVLGANSLLASDILSSHLQKSHNTQTDLLQRAVKGNDVESIPNGTTPCQFSLPTYSSFHYSKPRHHNEILKQV